jgi:hypothetical protein
VVQVTPVLNTYRLFLFILTTVITDFKKTEFFDYNECLQSLHHAYMFKPGPGGYRAWRQLLSEHRVAVIVSAKQG